MGDWLGKWAINQMLINVSTRKLQRSVRLPEGGVPEKKRLFCRNQPPPGILSRCRRCGLRNGWHPIFLALTCWKSRSTAFTWNRK